MLVVDGDELVVVEAVVGGDEDGVVVVGVVLPAGLVVVVVVGAGMVTLVARGTVVATGPSANVVVVEESGPRGRSMGPGEVVVVLSVTAARPSPPMSPASNSRAITSGEVEPSRSSSQLAPATTPTTRSVTVNRTIAPDMRRPMKTLLRREEPVLEGEEAASRSAICFARSSGLGLFRRFGWGNGQSLLPAAPLRGS